MIDVPRSRLKEILTEYKRSFNDAWWQGEKYKWEAVKCFQDNWNIDTPDFAEMLGRSLDKAKRFFKNRNGSAKGRILEFAKDDPDEVRSAFVELFNEEKDLFERMDTFEKRLQEMFEKYGGGVQSHYHDKYAISIYLWLHFPDKHYIYKSSVCKALGKKLNIDIRNFEQMYDEINAIVKEDDELVSRFHSYLTDECYRDPELKTLTMDFGYFVSSKDDKEDESSGASYTKADFLNEVFMSKERYDSLLYVLKYKKNIILQGAPGVGKTFAARRLAWSAMGEKDDKRIEFVQFHQNYSYEDFVMGFKPVADGFRLKDGLFYRFCKEAEKQTDKDFYFIIDEINRGNLSKIFGELLMLIERDYRGVAVTLAYNGENDEKFSVPENLYIIGMMNTADRSLAMIDYALRRRFSFFEIEPGFDTDGFASYQKCLNDQTFDALVESVKNLNREIADDRSLGRGFCIGHSYFCGAKECTQDWLRAIVEYDIMPTLEEYWFDDSEKINSWRNKLLGLFK